MAEQVAALRVAPEARVQLVGLNMPEPLDWKLTLPVGFTAPEAAGSVTVAVQVVSVLTLMDDGEQETPVVVVWAAMLEKLLLTRTTGMFVEVTPSMSVSEEPETPGALATFWIVNPAENPVTRNSTIIEVTFSKGGLGAPAGDGGGPTKLPGQVAPAVRTGSP